MRSIRSRLLALVVIAIVPAFVVVAIDAGRVESDSRSRVRRETKRLADTAADDDRDEFISTDRLLAVLADVPTIQTFNAGCGVFLRDQMLKHGPYANFAVVAPDGAVLCGANTPLVTADLTDHIRTALASNRTVVSGVHWRSGLRQICVLRPGPGSQGAFPTVVIAAIDVDKMNADVFTTRLPAGTVAARFDRNGELLAERGSPDRRAWPQADPVRLRETLMRTGDGYIEEAGADGVFRVFAMSSILLGGEPAVTHVIGLPQTTARALFSRTAVEDIVFSSIAALVTFGLAWIGSGTIVRALRRSESTARVQGENYRLLMEQAADAIFILDPSGRVVDMNSAACELLRCAPAALVGLQYLEMLPTDLRDSNSVWFAQALRGETVRTDATVNRTDGSPVRVEISAKRLSDDRIQAILRDMTGRLDLEAQLRQSQKMEAVGRLAGGIAHDFNNMLTVVLGYAGLLREELAGTPREGDAAEIIAAAERAAGLTRQLLSFSRRQVLQPQVFDLNTAAAEIGRMLQRVIGADIDLVIRPAPVPAIIKTDKGQIDQIVMNLAVNARDAMTDGGQVVIAVEVVPLGAGAQHRDTPGRAVRLSVADTGTGMTDDTKAHLFEPFFTTKPAGKGTGLGLAIVYGLVHQSGGTIRVESEIGHGSTFVIEFPLAAEAIDPEVSATAASEHHAGVETVLLVEDDPAVRRWAAGALRTHGFQVIEAPSGDEALALASANRPIDLLITDVVMPRMSGMALAAQIAAARPLLQVLFMSGYIGDEDEQSRQLPEGAAFLQKPFDAGRLVRTVSELLGGAARLPPPR